MIIDLWKQAKKVPSFSPKINNNLGREAKSFNDKDSMGFLAVFMGKKIKIMNFLDQMQINFSSLRNYQESYENCTGSDEESTILSSINEINDENSTLLKTSNKLLSGMKAEAKRNKYDPYKKDEPDTRVMVGITNALQTRIYKILQTSQHLQMDVKQSVKTKIQRQVKTADPNLTEDQIAEMIDNPQAVQEVLQKTIFSSAHGRVRNAMQDLNWKYQELGKLEKNMKALFEMMQDLSMIVKNQ